MTRGGAAITEAPAETRALSAHQAAGGISPSAGLAVRLVHLVLQQAVEEGVARAPGGAGRRPRRLWQGGFAALLIAARAVCGKCTGAAIRHVLWPFCRR